MMRDKLLSGHRPMVRTGLLAATTLLAGGSALAQTAANRDAANLLIPFMTLNATQQGRAALGANLETSIAINNASTAAQRAQAVSDNAIITDQGIQFSTALGTKLSAAYAAAAAANDPRLATTGNVVKAFRAFTGVSGADSAFDKTFFANGTTNNTTPATGIALPAGGIFNTYDIAYGIVPRSQNPNGDSRPFQVAPTRIDPFAAAITATLTTNSAFPSGHTTFGNTEALMTAIMVPERFQQVLTRGTEYGYSRVVLGAHYVLDVIGGRILAYHDVAQLLNDNPDYTGGADYAALFAAATTDYRAVLADGCGGTVAACAAAADTTRFADYAQNKADYTYRLTYGLPAVGRTDLAPVVPAGAEVLLATRFPYLNAAQRRDVLASTEAPSGAALDDGSGWARLNLFAAGGGYGALTGIVIVAMDASKGGFNAYDTWLNDIGGNGSLLKTGTGTLALAGNDSFSGSVTVSGGTLLLLGDHALPSTAAVSNAATLSLQDGVAGGTATVASYAGAAGSRLLVDANLAAGTADRLVVTGTVGAGTATAIAINDLSGATPAGYNPAGIPIVVAGAGGGLVAGEFTLAGGPIDKGLFRYDLAVTGTQVALVGTPSADARRLAAVTTGAQTLWFEGANAWLDHQGELRDATVAGDKKASVWLRGFGRWLDRRQTGTTAGADGEFTSYRQRPNGVLGGVDITSHDVVGAGDRLIVGLSGGYVHSRQTFAGSATRVRQNGGSVGLSASYVTASGLFLDVAAKADLTRLSLDVPGLAPFGTSAARHRVHTYGAIGEAGYRLPLGTAAFVEPVASIAYADADLPDFALAGSNIRFDNDDAVRGRLGLRAGTVLTASDTSRIGLSGDASVWRRFSDRATATIDGGAAAPLLTLADPQVKTFGDAGATLTYASLGSGFSAFARGGYQFASDYHSYAATAGVRMAF